MNVYDFDDTIYDGDSTVDFFLFCARRHPKTWLSIPKQAVALVAMALKLMKRDAAKQMAMAYLKHVPNVDEALAAFWRQNTPKLKDWYLAQKHPDDVIISASPAFILQPVCKALGVALIATPVDKHTGRFAGPNCRGQEKVVRFRQAHGDAAIEEFYSDSMSDAPLAALAQRAYMVKKDDITPWPV